jgi:hypothetical protein
MMAPVAVAAAPDGLLLCRETGHLQGAGGLQLQLQLGLRLGRVPVTVPVAVPVMAPAALVLLGKELLALSPACWSLVRAQLACSAGQAAALPWPLATVLWRLPPQLHRVRWTRFLPRAQFLEITTVWLQPQSTTMGSHLQKGCNIKRWQTKGNGLVCGKSSVDFPPPDCIQ